MSAGFTPPAREKAGTVREGAEGLGPGGGVSLPGSTIRGNTRQMAIDMYAQLFRGLAELRFAATSKRLRAFLDDATLLDTTHAMLVWEPRRVVPSYAVPPGDLHLADQE